jgi:hypothetical protein
MTDDKLLDLMGLRSKKKQAEQPKIVAVQPAPILDTPAPAGLDDDDEDFIVYGADRTRRPRLMLSLLQSDGISHHIPYPHIVRIMSCRDESITILTFGCTFTIEGDKLAGIVARLKRQDLSYIREGKGNNPAVAPDGTRVDKIKIEVDG